MATLHAQRPSTKVGGHHFSPSQTGRLSREHARASEFPSRKSTKRKLPGSSLTATTSMDGKDHGSVPTNIRSDQGSSSLTDDCIETDGIAASNGTVHHNYLSSTSGAVAGSSSRKSSVSNTQNGQGSSTNTASGVSAEEYRMVVMVSYVLNMLVDNVKESLLSLKGQGVDVTQDLLFEECFKSMSSHSIRTGKPQSFPQHLLSGETKAIGQTASTQSGLDTGGSFTSGGDSNGHISGPAPSQASTNYGDGVPSEDQVDSIGPYSQGTVDSNVSCPSKMDPVVAAYHSKVNNVSSHSSARDGGRAQGPAAGHSIAPSTTTSEKDVNHAYPPAQSEASGISQGMADLDGQPPSHAKESVLTAPNTQQSCSAKVQENTALSSDTQNDLDKESPQDGQTTAEPSTVKPLKERDPTKYLATCLRLVRNEYKRLDIARHCGECGNKPRDITFLPCGHVWACRACAVPLYVCPCCKKSIIATVDTYLC